MFENMLYAVSSYCLLVIAATMFVRANDLRWRAGAQWQVRFIGFSLAGVGGLIVPLYDLYKGGIPSFWEVVFRIGVTCVFVTTPYLPPWWEWLTGNRKARWTHVAAVSIILLILFYFAPSWITVA